MNPSLHVPTIVLDDGRPLGEFNAILWYFGDGTPFVPEDRYERAQFLRASPSPFPPERSTPSRSS